MTTDQTRRRILEAAAAEFTEKGFAGATTRAIADRAQVNEVTLFRHFGNKQRLFSAVVDDAPLTHSLIEKSLAQMQAMPPRQALEMIGMRQLEGLEEHLGWLRLQMMEPGSVPQTLRFPGFRFRSYLADCIRRWQDAGALRADVSPEMASESFATAIFGFVLANRVVFPSDAAPPAEVFVKTHVDIFLSGIETDR